MTVSAVILSAAETPFIWHADRKTGRCLDTARVRHYALYPDNVEIYFLKEWGVKCVREQDGEKLILKCRSTVLYYFRDQGSCRETARGLHSRFLKKWNSSE